ncbi:HMA2 domain-containing protein [Dissulfurispira sp.]|uniref:HMA2 domain-containing protein n=1 Tax=Dissulfurispira sp. TaxID=2817609 RepID=UPI002FD9192E
MAPLSILPGRVRFESPGIVGQLKTCSSLRESICRLDGVLDASVNYRTGRILVKFNEYAADGDKIAGKIKELIKNAPLMKTRITDIGIQKDKGAHGIVRHAIIDAVAGAILPRPLNVIAPLFITAAMK